MWETLREAIDEEMEADPTVLVMGMQPLSTNHPVITAYGIHPIRPCMLVPDLNISSLLEVRPNFFQTKFTHRYPELNSNFCTRSNVDLWFVGEDVGHYGGSYKCTYDLYKKYGDMRLLDTPICGMFASTII